MILIVDDDPAVSRAHARWLRALGHASHCVHDGCSALAYAAQHKLSLIVLDLTMPGMDGLQVLQTLKADPATAATPVIVCSASPDAGDPARALALGAAEFVDKLGADWERITQRILPRDRPAAG